MARVYVYKLLRVRSAALIREQAEILYLTLNADLLVLWYKDYEYCQ